MSFWNPVSWWNDATKTASGVASAVENWTKQAITKAIGLVENDIKDAIGYSESIFSDAISWSQSLFAEAERDVASAVGTAEHLYNVAAADARSLAATAVKDAEGLFNRAEADARSWIGAAINDAEGLFNRAEADARSWIGAAINDAEGLFNRAEHDAFAWYGDARAWATSEAGRLASDAYNLVVKDFVDPFLEVWRISLKAVEWLTWFAEHPFTVVHDVEADVIDWSRQLPRELAGTLSGTEGKGILDAVTAWLG